MGTLRKRVSEERVAAKAPRKRFVLKDGQKAGWVVKAFDLKGERAWRGRGVETIQGGGGGRGRGRRVDQT